MTGPVVTLWHFSVPYDDYVEHACVPAALSDVALRGLRHHDPVWSDPNVKLHGGWVVDGVHYRCRPRLDRAVTWFTDAS